MMYNARHHFLPPSLPPSPLSLSPSLSPSLPPSLPSLPPSLPLSLPSSFPSLQRELEGRVHQEKAKFERLAKVKELKEKECQAKEEKLLQVCEIIRNSPLSVKRMELKQSKTNTPFKPSNKDNKTEDGVSVHIHVYTVHVVHVHQLYFIALSLSSSPSSSSSRLLPCTLKGRPRGRGHYLRTGWNTSLWIVWRTMTYYNRILKRRKLSLIQSQNTLKQK